MFYRTLDLIVYLQFAAAMAQTLEMPLSKTKEFLSSLSLVRLLLVDM